MVGNRSVTCPSPGPAGHPTLQLRPSRRQLDLAAMKSIASFGQKGLWFATTMAALIFASGRAEPAPAPAIDICLTNSAEPT